MSTREVPVLPSRSLPLAALGVALAAAAARAGDRFSCDFDGDGFDDLVCAVPFEDFGTNVDTGVLHVVYGDQDYPSPPLGNDFFREGLDGLGDGALPREKLGSAWAAGDFDHDGFDDLAIGIQGNDDDAGMVVVLYGAPLGGLSTGRVQAFTQDSPFVHDTAESDDLFGAALAAGDFNRDGYDDLAIGVPGEDLGTALDAGAVHVLLGGDGGLFTFLSSFWHQDVEGILDAAETNDEFGEVLAAGDFDGDGFEDLAIGVPDEDVDGQTDAGLLQVLFGGSSTGLSSRDQVFHQNLGTIAGACESFDRFARAIAVGNYAGDARDDLVVGIPGEDLGSTASAGAIVMIHGAAGGLVVPAAHWLDESSGGLFGIPEDPETGDEFGAALALGDFDGDGRKDLAIGAPGELVAGKVDAGGVFLLKGRSGGFTSADARYIAFDFAWSSAQPQENGKLGSGLHAADYGGGSAADLAIGVPGSSRIAFLGGEIYVLGFDATLFTGSFEPADMVIGRYQQELTGMPDSCEQQDQFGSDVGGG